MTLLKRGDKGIAVRDLQAALNRNGAQLYLDGDFGPATEAAVIAYQRRINLVVDGIAGPKTLAALAGEDSSHLLHESDLQRAAERLSVDLAAIKAINEVESRGTGFHAPGQPVILYERHIMHRQLSRPGHGSDPQQLAGQLQQLSATQPDLVNPRPGGYLGGLREYPRLARAKMIDANAAIESTSWGLYQIMGFHWQLLGYASPTDYEAAMQRSESDHLDAFVRFIEADRNLHRALKNRKWTDFARRYNGPAYASNLYDTKLARAYDRHTELA